MNLIEQPQDTPLPSVPQTAKFTLTQFSRTESNPLQQALRRRHTHGGTILHAEQNICIETALEHT